MNKKILISILVFIITTCMPIISYAGDIPESIMMGKQKSLFIGVLSKTGSKTYTVEPKTVLMGEVDKGPLVIEKFDKYYGTSDKPKAGDIIVAVQRNDTQVDDLWIFKATSDDYKTLKLVSEKYNMVKRYEKYINEGEYQKAQDRIKAKQQEETAVKPVTGTAETDKEEAKKEEVKPAAVKSEVVESGKTSVKLNIIFISAILIALMVGTVVYLRRRRYRA